VTLSDDLRELGGNEHEENPLGIKGEGIPEFRVYSKIVESTITT